MLAHTVLLFEKIREVPIGSAAQLLISPLLANPAIFQDDDLVSILDRGQSMGNDHDRASAHHTV